MREGNRPLASDGDLGSRIREYRKIAKPRTIFKDRKFSKNRLTARICKQDECARYEGFFHHGCRSGLFFEIGTVVWEGHDARAGLRSVTDDEYDEPRTGIVPPFGLTDWPVFFFTCNPISESNIVVGVAICRCLERDL